MQPLISVQPHNSIRGIDVLHVPSPISQIQSAVQRHVSPRSKALCRWTAPGDRNNEYAHNDLPVFSFAGTKRPDLSAAYGAPDEEAALAFSELLKRLRPRIVNLHALSPAVSERLVDAAHSNRVLGQN
jgi:hypothetical protein